MMHRITFRCFSTLANMIKNTQPRLCQRPSMVNSHHASISVSKWARNYTQPTSKLESPRLLTAVKINSDILDLEYNNGLLTKVPFVWLRDNCQCPLCYSHTVQGRLFLMENLDVDIQPKEIQVSDSGNLYMRWTDGHESTFESLWLLRRRFEKINFTQLNQQEMLPKLLWGKEHEIKTFAWDNLMQSDKDLHEWLKTMEISGISLITRCRDDSKAGIDLIERIAFLRQTHYGVHSQVYNRPNPSNLAFAPVKLGLHTDLPFYEYVPGIIFLHMVLQTVGHGGESIACDGFGCAERLRQTNPKAFQLLTEVPVCFRDVGEGIEEGESEQFLKILKKPIIQINGNKEVMRINFNNQVRDSLLDLPATEVKEFYKATKELHDICYHDSVKLKVNRAEILVLDNLRCLHGRTAFSADSERHLEALYLDWDEAKCCRRRLERNLHYLQKY